MPRGRGAARGGADRHGPTGGGSDDGIVLRLPEGEKEPDGSLFVFGADEITDIVTEQVGGSALFASRFRECAARALLLPRRNPGKRAPCGSSASVRSSFSTSPASIPRSPSSWRQSASVCKTSTIFPR